MFCDLFLGGGAVTHAGMLSGKWKRFIVNDIDARLPKLFLECACGKHTVENHPEWISREEFYQRKDDDIYIALVWSFGNNGCDYLYGADAEGMKHAYHKAVYFDDLKALKEYGYKLTKSDKQSLYERYLDYQRQIKRQNPSVRGCEFLERQIEIERLQSLQSLQSFGIDYQSVPIPQGALIYCDIPYCGTNCGKYDGFDHNRFYEWAEKQDNIYISEYSMPDEFIPIACIEKQVLSAANGNSQKIEEKIFTNKRTYKKLDSITKERIGWNLAEQLTLF